MGWKPEPLNPLQHKGQKMTLEHYAKSGVDNEWEVQRRCCEKYAGDPAKRQPWMEKWMAKTNARKDNQRQAH